MTDSSDGSSTVSRKAAPATSTRGRKPATDGLSPAAALARHIEWLEFALAAARSEESWRVGRLDKANRK
ncbi:MAG: hypothetical protein ABIZ72_05270, partial [Candidatus Limnocylindrales bacterium]